MAENALDGTVLGVAWDGTGYGPDGTVWGGEFLSVGNDSWTRVASLRPFRLPGGERAVQEPRRSALGVLHALAGDAAASFDVPTMRAFDATERRLLLRALDSGLNAPVTTSAGRLFDAVASLIGVRQKCTFEGQAAMALEALASEDAPPYDFVLDDRFADFAETRWKTPPLVVDWRPMIEGLLADMRHGSAALVAGRVHATMATMIAAVARRLGARRVVLSGGCFQNRLLLERAIVELRGIGVTPYWHQRVPPNDGGIALGQIAAYARHIVQSDSGERQERVVPYDDTALAADHR
jgi:hydrogenase maturation protein HypF